MNIEHLSYSTLAKYNSCPRSVYLEKIREAESVPAWYFVVGSAVHSYVESRLSERSDPVEDDSFFWDEYRRALQIEPDTSLWLHGGSKQEPVRDEAALALYRACTEAALEFLEDFEVWEVEYDATGFLPGCDLPIKAYVDAIGEHKKHGPLIIDWKTGRSKPKDQLQLETYNALLQNFEGDNTFKGLWVMLNPGASKAKPFEFRETPESMGAMYGAVADRIRAGVWPTVVQYNCRFCTQRPNCKLGGGVTERSMYYDRVIEDGGIPF